MHNKLKHPIFTLELLRNERRCTVLISRAYGPPLELAPTIELALKLIQQGKLGWGLWDKLSDRERTARMSYLII